MMWLFFVGWIAGVISTLLFGKLYSERHKIYIDDETARRIMMACKADEVKDNDECTGKDP